MGRGNDHIIIHSDPESLFDNTKLQTFPGDLLAACILSYYFAGFPMVG